MKPGIDPKVDYAFKRLFGSPGHERMLLNLLNAVLVGTIPRPVTSVELLNPFDEKDTSDDKLAILDIKARDETGQLFNIEMQMRLDGGYPGRALYYLAGLFRDQLKEGDDYVALRPAIGIHFLDAVFAPGSDKHLHYAMRERSEPIRLFSPLLQLHVLQLPLVPADDAIADDLDRWCYFLRHGEDLDREALPVKMATEPIREAMGVLAMMTMTPKEKERYEARRRFEMDRTSGLKYARMEGLEEGIAKGKIEGKVEGKIEALHDAAILLVKTKFPGANPQVVDRIRDESDPEVLKAYLLKISQAAVFEPLD